MYKIVLFISSFLWAAACGKKSTEPAIPTADTLTFVSAADLSAYPEIQTANPRFYAADGTEKEMPAILREKGVNAVRLKLWVNPENRFAGFDEVKKFAQTLQTKGFKIWLTVHYSDTWADPGQQQTPRQWQGLGIAALSDSVAAYTQKIVREIKPDFIQIGNEINSGFLHPLGHMVNNYQNFTRLLASAAAAVRTHAPNTKIILHFAGIDGADWFFNQVKQIDYDIIGLSYYPIWHGKSFPSLQNRMEQLSVAHHKRVVIAETAYPFTLNWNDWTHNM